MSTKPGFGENKGRVERFRQLHTVKQMAPGRRVKEVRLLAGTIFDNTNCRSTQYGSDAGIGYLECSILGTNDCSVNQGWVDRTGLGTLLFWVTCQRPASYNGPITIRTWSDSTCSSPLKLFDQSDTFTGNNAECVAPVEISGVPLRKSVSLVGGTVGLGFDVGVKVGVSSSSYVTLYGFQNGGCVNKENSKSTPDYANVVCTIGQCSQGSYYQASTGKLSGAIWATCATSYIGGYPILQDTMNFWEDDQCTIATNSLLGVLNSPTQPDNVCFNATVNYPYFGSFYYQYSAATNNHSTSKYIILLALLSSIFSIFL